MAVRKFKGASQMSTVYQKDMLLRSFQHYGNSLHVYSMLCRFFDAPRALRIACLYEGFIHHLLYRKETTYHIKREMEFGTRTVKAFNY
jgi:hypothetical protein